MILEFCDTYDAEIELISQLFDGELLLTPMKVNSYHMNYEYHGVNCLFLLQYWTKVDTNLSPVSSYVNSSC